MTSAKRPWLGVPQQKYEEDAQYRHVVDMLESIIHSANFTPGEIREAAVLACIHYEQRNVSRMLRIVNQRGSFVLAADDEHSRMIHEAEERLHALKEFLAAFPLAELSLERRGG